MRVLEERKLQHCVLLVPSPGAKSPNSCSGLEGHHSASWERPGYTSDNNVGLWYTDRLCAETLSLSSEGLIQYNCHHDCVHQADTEEGLTLEGSVHHKRTLTLLC